ncbi:ArnT family glycosyltransferase [Mariniphaga sp.]|uniref:ArnT family glycosyltransferase n=1 Tax=Mariniphaga sp. TaxID=1954475 RepID=UPI003564499C
MNNLTRKHYYLIGAWFFINLLQAIFTGLHSDESYYWMYSENLAWGFFDHPPMAALFIHLGHLLLPGELGVRLFVILLSTATFALILNELNEKEDLFFLGVFVFSFPLIHTHIAGFLAIPDVPLLFFILWFLIFYRKFLQKPSILLSVLLAVVVAAMIYSKYHAFLVIGFTVLSNLKLLRNKYFWITVVISVLLLIPHVWWQIENEFPTFKYHLVERAKPFRLKHITDNLLNQLVMAGPLTGLLVFWKLTKFKIKNDFDRALVFNIVGFYLVLFLLSFKNRIEAHWAAAIMPMLMLATYPLVKNDFKIKTWFKRLAVPVIALMFLYRIYLALDVIPNVGYTKITFYNREAHALEIKELAQGKKVGFFDNYAAISNYIFYTDDSAVHLSTPTYRFNQYDLWNEEKFAEGEPVFTVQSKHLNPPNLQLMATGQEKGFIVIEEFQSLKGLEIEVLNTVKKDGVFYFEVGLHNNNPHPILINHISEPTLALMQNRDEMEIFRLASYLNNEKIDAEEVVTFRISVPEEKIDTDLPVTIYTRTKENIRGEISSLKIP